MLSQQHWKRSEYQPLGDLSQSSILLTLEMNFFSISKKVVFLASVWFFALSIITSLPSLASAQDRLALADKLRIGVADYPPYAMKGEDGKWHGLSIELWQALAKELEIDYGIKEFSRLKQAAEALRKGELDVIPTMAVTEKNEIVMDLSHSYHRTGLAIAVPRYHPGYDWISFAKRFAAKDTLQVVIFLLLLALIAGVIIWMLENKKNREMFGGRRSKGIGHGIWWAMVTMTTVGYGDKAPRTISGRVVAVVWMFFSIMLITSYTAVITASFTVDELSGRVRSSRDLPTARVGALIQTESLEYLVNKGIPVLSFEDVLQGLQAVEKNQIDAFVDNEALLEYLVKNEFQGKIRVLPETFAHDFVSMALPAGSPLREPLDRALAKIMDSDTWIDLKLRYIGRVY